MATQSKLAVILHADVVGSTGLVRMDESLAHDRIHAAFQGFSRCVQRYGGIVHEVRGDALVAEFHRTSDAVLAALAAQQDNSERNASLTDEFVPVLRVGIALGDVVIADNTVTGAGVILAQRLEQLAEPGGVCVSSAVREAVPDRLPIDFTDLGAQEVKGFDSPVSVCAVALKPDRELPAPAPAAATQQRSRTLRRLTIATAAVLVIAIGGFVIWLQWRLDLNGSSLLDPVPATSDKVSIAVLPFVNLSDDREQVYFSEGIAEDIITDLTKVPGLMVIARNSSFSFKGKDLDSSAIGRQLGVSFLVDGSVRRAAQTLRVNVQLIDTQSSAQLWAERYEGDVGNIFAFQDQIRQSILSTLRVQLTGPERTTETHSPEAYDLVLRATDLFRKLRYPDAQQAKKLLEEAASLDPEWGRPLALIGQYHFDEWRLWGEGRDANLEAAIRYSELAIAKDPAIPEPHVVAAQAHQFLRQFELAKKHADQAMALDPNDAATLANLGALLRYSGRGKEAVDVLERAIRSDPFHPPTYLEYLGHAYYLVGRYEDCLAAVERGLALNPSFIALYVVMTRCHEGLGNEEAAKEAGKRILELNPTFTISAYSAYTPYSAPEDEADAVRALKLAGIPE